MVEFTSENLGRILINRLRKNENFDEIISIVKNNSQGNIYLVGGTVSRTLASELYGGKQKNQDFDFVVDVLNDELKIPEGWTVTHHKFNNPTFKKNDIEIDIFPISDHQYIKNNNLEPTIENFLAGVPFSIQALVFDIKHEKLIGKDGIEALKNRKFKVHNVESAKEVAKRKGVSINKRMMQKAESMNFEIIPFD
jgi:tRNA nucleotidyltransferase/poly(A) polymerase